MGNHRKATASAIVSGLIAFLSALLTALQGEHSGFGTVTAGQWVTCAIAFLIGLGLTGGTTYQVSNKPAEAPAADEEAPAPVLSGRRRAR